MHGAWVIVLLVPIMVFALARLNRRYEEEAEALEADVPNVVTAPVLRRHVVLVFVDQLDLAAGRALQYARTLHPNDLRAVHFALDLHHAERLAESWRELGLSGIPLELVECPDRRLTRAAVETVAVELADGETEVSVLLPDRQYRGIWGRLLHDRTADGIVREVSKLAHANVTQVPFHFDAHRPTPVPVRADAVEAAATNGHHIPRRAADGIAIGEVCWRDRVTIEGRVRSLRVRPLADVPSLEVAVTDGTGTIAVVFHGRREIPGITVGTLLQVNGTAIDHHGRLAILNPAYTLLAKDG